MLGLVEFGELVLDQLGKLLRVSHMYRILIEADRADCLIAIQAIQDLLQVVMLGAYLFLPQNPLCNYLLNLFDSDEVS